MSINKNGLLKKRMAGLITQLIGKNGYLAKKIVYIAILFSLLFPPVSYAQKELNTYLNNVNFEDFIKFVSKRTNHNFSFESSIIPKNIKVTIYSPLALSNDDLIKILHSVLKENGLVSVKKGKNIVIIRVNSLRNIGAPYQSSLKAASNSVITTIIRLKNVAVSKLKLPLMHLVSSFGHVDAVSGLNALIITDSQNKVVQMEKLVKDIDKSQSYNINLFPIKGVSSKIVANELKGFFSNIAARSDLSYRPIIFNETASNSIMIASREQNSIYIKKLVEQIVEHLKGQKAQKVFYLKNAVAKDVYNIIMKLLSKNPLFKKSSISYDSATNSIIVLGSPEIYDKIEKLISKLDIPLKQVYVEALILETSLSKLSEFGIEWSGVASKGSNVGFTNNSTTGTLANLQNSILNNNQLTAIPGGFSLGILGNVVTYQGTKFPTLGMLLNALKQKQGINILSNPHIITLDNQKASIFVGENRPFLISQKYDTNGNPIFSYDYRDVGIKLTVLPHISNGKVIMDTDIEIKKVTSSVGSSTEAAPVTLTRTTKTKLSLANGEKILISGLIKNDKTYTNQGVPLLSSVPLLGELFKYKKVQSEKTNLMIFLTAKIINNQKELKKLSKQNNHNEN